MYVCIMRYNSLRIVPTSGFHVSQYRHNVKKAMESNIHSLTGLYFIIVLLKLSFTEDYKYNMHCELNNIELKLNLRSLQPSTSLFKIFP